MIKWRKLLSKDLPANLSTDYEGRCGNCQAYLEEGDQYCRYCGTKRGKGKFKPYENVLACIYGSPLTCIHQCKKCGTTFESTMGTRPKFCYHCGRKIKTYLEEELASNPALQYPQSTAQDKHGNSNTAKPAKSMLVDSVILYQQFMDGWTQDGKRCGGEHRIEYCHKERIVEESHTFYGEGISQCKNIDCVLAVPVHILFKEDLIHYIKFQKPNWEIEP